MLGAIIGDIVGSRFEWNNIKTKETCRYHSGHGIKLFPEERNYY